MKKTAVLTLSSVLLASFPIGAREMTAPDILGHVDAVLNAAMDQQMKMKLVLIDKDGHEKEREAVMLQKGREKRMIKFLSPADQKGIAFLDLPDDVMYLYLPAFKKVRRIASHIKNQNFAGTDMSYDDMGTIEYHEEYDPVLLEADEAHYILELTPKPGSDKDYSRLKVWVLRDSFYPEKMEFFDKKGTLRKEAAWRKIEREGDFWIAREVEFHDIKDDHKTLIIVMDIKFNSGLKDDLFTQRYLKR